MGVFGVWLTASGCLAEDDIAASSNNPPAFFQTVLRSEEIVADKPVQRAYVNYGTNRFAFVVPSGLRLNASNPEKIVLSNENYSCLIVLRVAHEYGFPPEPLNVANCREWALSRYPDAQILDQFTQSAAGHSGPAFDLRWANTANVDQLTRIAFIPSPAGVLQFNLITNTEDFTQGQYLLSCVMLSFRSNEGGELRVLRLSTKF